MGKRFSTVDIGISLKDLEAEVDQCMKDVGTEQAFDAKLEQSVSEFTPGAILKGKIVRIAGDDIVVDIGYKSEGFIPKQEFESLDGVEPGVMLEVYLDQIEDSSGLVVLSKKKADRIRGWERVMETYKVGDVVKGKAVRKIKGGLLVDIGVHVFLPASQIDVRRVGDPGEWIGKEMECKIIKIDNDRRNIVLSRRKMLEDERDRMKKDLLGNIQRGEVRRGVVKNITDFGAFIDLGGIDGLLHITDMSWGRIQHPSEVLKVDQTVEVKVLDFDLERERISLGLKQLSPNPWMQVPTKYPIGSKHSGEVVNIMPYGAFVKLEAGVEGLVHVSEMSWTRINHPQEVLREGQEIEVVILKMDLNAGRISLGMRQILPDPWAGIGEHYHVGDVVDCVVSRIVPFGAFVQLPEGIEGIVPNAEMGTRKGKGEALRPGSKVEAKITELRPDERKMTLSIRHLQREEETRRERQVVEEYQTRPEREEPRFTIGDALRAKEDHGEDE